AVESTARITLGCPAIQTQDQVFAWQRIVDFIHVQSKAKIALQLGHAGRKAGSNLPWETPQNSDVKESFSASPIAYNDQLPVPRELDMAQMDRIADAFASAARNAESAGFDMIELQ